MNQAGNFRQEARALGKEVQTVTTNSAHYKKTATPPQDWTSTFPFPLDKILTILLRAATQMVEVNSNNQMKALEKKCQTEYTLIT